MTVLNRVAILTGLCAVATGVLPAAENRIRGAVDRSRVAVVKGNLHLNARPEFDRGAVDPATELPEITLLLHPAPGLESFLAELQDPASPNYHKWLSPEQFADRFGMSAADLDKVTGWLRSEGLEVRDVARGRHWLTFRGTAGRVGRAL